MKPLTEQELRLALKDGAPAVWTVPPGTPVTPAAREYLRQRRVSLVFSETPKTSAAAEGRRAPEPFLGPDGGTFAVKPENLTHLSGRRLVAKDHPIIVWRGRLDAFCARLIEVQLLALAEGRPELAGELQEILAFCRRLLRAELKEEALEEFNLLGLSAADLRERSHHPAKFFGRPHILMSYKMGPLAAALNSLRAEIRVVETAAAFGLSRRDDLMLALNRLSSLFYILIHRYLPPDFKPEDAGV